MPTAFRDAFERAGVDVAGAELYKLATEALRNHGGSAKKATPKFCTMLRKRNDLLTAMASELLSRVAADMSAAAAIAAKPVPVKDVDVVKHRRQRPRTDSERAGALSAARTVISAIQSIFDERKIDGQSIGEMRWGELREMVRTKASNASSYLRLGTDATEDALLLDKIEAFTQVADHSTKIRDAMSAKDLERLNEEAKREAPKLVEMGMRKYAQTIADRSGREIAP